MKIYFCLGAIKFQCNFVLRPSKVRKLVRMNQFQVKSTKMGTGERERERERDRQTDGQLSLKARRSFFLCVPSMPESQRQRLLSLWRKAVRCTAGADKHADVQIFVRYPFSYFRLETGSYELIFVLSRALKQNYIEIQWPQDKNKFSSGFKFRTFFKSTKVRN